MKICCTYSTVMFAKLADNAKACNGYVSPVAIVHKMIIMIHENYTRREAELHKRSKLTQYRGLLLITNQLVAISNQN